MLCRTMQRFLLTRAKKYGTLAIGSHLGAKKLPADSAKIPYGEKKMKKKNCLFGQVYEFFSHGVYSLDMMFAFAYPLLGGVIPFGLLWLSRKAVYPAPLIATIYHCGIATCTVGCLIRGVLEIYGTTNRLSVFYNAVGIPLLVIGAHSLLRTSSTA